MKASEIRELLKYASVPGVISFGGGLPNPKTFPVDALVGITEKVLRENGASALQYGTTEGADVLREAIAKRMREKKNMDITKDNVSIMSGSQQALDLLAKLFLEPGKTAIVEAPTYLAALGAFKPYEGEVVGVEMDEDGLKTDELEKKMKAMKNEGKFIPFIYTIPSFQNPSGVTMSLDRRKHLLEIASEFDVLVVEDDPYGELRYAGNDIPTLKSLDKEGRVIYFGTISKILAPGLRTGWVIADEEIVHKFVVAKQATDLCTNTLSQYIIAEAFNSGLVENHIPEIRKLYSHKRNLMLDMLEDKMPEGTRWTKPEGGMFLWVWTPESVNTMEMFPKAIENGIAYVVGEAFYPDRSVKNAMRLNFTFSSDEEIKEGVGRLAKTIREFM
jgi:2-aminoadipate transaminase